MRLQLILAFLLIVTAAVARSQAKGQQPAGEPAGNSSIGEVTDLQKKADAGDPLAEFALGHAYETGKGLPQNFEQAVVWYRKAAEHGNAKAQSSLGILYWMGEGVEKDRKQAVEWYHKAARQGDASAMFNLGVAYYNGEGVVGDEAKAHAWFILASEAGSEPARDAAKRSQSEHPGAFSDACLAIGEMYQKGEDLPPNLELAIAWYKKSAGDSHRVSRDGPEWRLANIYLKESNFVDARPWCQGMAEGGVLDGEYCLGHLYQNGLGVKEDLKTAFQWYEHASRKGHIAAMYALGQMYEDGQGTKVDHAEAMYWLIRSGSLGNSKAATEARKLRTSMDDREWKEIQKKLLERKFDLNEINAFLQANTGQPPH